MIILFWLSLNNFCCIGAINWLKIKKKRNKRHNGGGKEKAAKQDQLELFKKKSKKSLQKLA